MNIKNKLIKELSTKENISFLIELNELFPEILNEYYTRLFEDKLQIPEEHNNYKLFRGDDGNIKIFNNDHMGDYYFCLALFTKKEDTNFYYGIVGQWEKFNMIDEVKHLKNYAESIGLKYWTNWMYSYFESKRDSIFNCIKLEKNIDTVFPSFQNEFTTFFNLVKEPLEQANKAISKTKSIIS